MFFQGTIGATQVIIKARATKEYTTKLAERDSDQPISYHFLKGFFYPGNISDKSLAEVDFMDIATNLAMHLTKQNYYPSKDTEKNDVIVVVNWGVTAVEDDVMDMWNISSQEEYEELYGLGDGTTENNQRLLETFGPSETPNLVTADRRKNSGLLGFEETLQSTNVMPQDQYDLESALNRERYFIVVMAYDYQKMKQNKEMNLLWITRFSMKSTGFNFSEAYQELTFAASDYFGKNMKGLQKKRSGDRSKVEVGEIEVLDTVKE